MDRRTFLMTAAAASGSLAVGTRVTAAAGRAGGAGGPFELPALPYAPDALEPHLDARTMELHHGKHHAGYTAKLNEALKALPSWGTASIESILGQLTTVGDPALQATLRNHGGGFYNHCLFWEVMAPVSGTGKRSTALGQALEKKFGSLSGFQEALTNAASSQFGSGWAWLLVRQGELLISATANQDNPLMKGILPDEHVGIPILGVDVWEHAYYLNYQNQRGDYLKAWWNVVNWDRVSQNFDRALAAGS